jgi:hypothetical protein
MKARKIERATGMNTARAKYRARMTTTVTTVALRVTTERCQSRGIGNPPGVGVLVPRETQ